MDTERLDEVYARSDDYGLLQLHAQQHRGWFSEAQELREGDLLP